MSSAGVTAPEAPQEVGSRLRVGLFGRLGSGNIGNDASMEAVLDFLRRNHSDAQVDALCYGAEHVSTTYGIETQALSWYHEHWRDAAGAAAGVLKALGKGFDFLRTAAWVRRHDAVIIPGMGVLETSLPVRASEFPYSLFLMCALGKVFRTQVAFVCVGAGPIKKRITRSLFDSAARFASYRSYRDAASRAVMSLRGVDTANDRVFPDLAFALPSPVCDRGDAQLVGIGVMAYRGGNDDRKEAESIYISYVELMTQFVIWLVDSGRRVRMIVGDTNGSDQTVVQAILDHVHHQRPDLDPSFVQPMAVSSLADVMQALAPVGSVVAMRYHNVVGALKLCKPTIALSYAPKHEALMSDFGLSEFCLQVRSTSTSQLVARFTDLVRRSEEVSGILAEHLSDSVSRLDTQFAELSHLLASAARHETRASAWRHRWPTGRVRVGKSQFARE